MENKSSGPRTSKVLGFVIGDSVLQPRYVKCHCVSIPLVVDTLQ